MGGYTVDDESVIESFLEGRPRADQLGHWAASLQQRLATVREEASRSGDTTPRTSARIKELQRQIAALSQEMAITEFVEDSVRVTLAMGSVADVGGEDS